MEDPNDMAQAIYIKEGIIKKVGTLEEIQKLETPKTKKVDLKGKTLMPSFIDAHSHLTAFAQVLGIVDLKECTNFDKIKEKLLDYKNKNKIKKDEWIIGFGYDHNFLKEKTHPDKYMLDEILNENPVVITHTSGHMGVVNTKGLEILNINKQTKNPEGGTIGRINNTNEPNGYLEETAFVKNLSNVINFDLKKYTILIKKAINEYLKNGITTIQDGLTKKKEWDILKNISKNHHLEPDIICYIDIKENSDILENNKDYLKKYNNKLKIGGYKLILDGSPQGKTAWLTKPYEGEKEYRGYGVYKDEEVINYVKKSLEENVQLLTHCNGDAASDQLIKAYEKQNNLNKNERPVMIHAQTVRYDQLDKMKDLNIIPSFFITHIYYWGDIHIKNLGKRANKISPANYAKKLGLKYTFHQDTPVLNPNILEMVHVAVNRKTKSQKTLGEEEKISVFDALKAVTINAAYQYFEEDKKGSIKEGKLADLVILDKNPLKVPKEEIKNINVLETLKEGKTCYKKD